MNHIAKYIPQAPLSSPDAHKQFLAKNWLTHVTVDLKDATDLLSVGLLQAFPANYRTMVERLRSKYVETPLGRSPMTAMFPMGNSLCFVTLTYVVVALCEMSCDNSYSVYGDDIICHRDDYAQLVDRIHRFGLKVNAAKCGLASLKETCGLDLLNGEPLDPVYLRLWDPEMGPKGKWACATAADQLFNNGFCFLAEHFKSLLPKGWIDFRSRYNRNLQRLEYFVPTLIDKTRTVDLRWPFSGYRWLATRADNDAKDTKSKTFLSLSSHRMVVRFKWCIVIPFNLMSRD